MSFKVNFLFKKIGLSRNPTIEQIDQKIQDVQNSIDETFRGLKINNTGTMVSVSIPVTTSPPILNYAFVVNHNLGYIPSNYIVTKINQTSATLAPSGYTLIEDGKANKNQSFLRLYEQPSAGSPQTDVLINIWVF